MTIKARFEVQELSDQELNIKIAEFEGMTQIKEQHGELQGIPKCCRGWVNVPDYAHDLNAIIGLTSSKDTSFQVGVAQEIWNLLGRHDHVEIEAINVDARTRAQAFILESQQRQGADNG